MEVKLVAATLLMNEGANDFAPYEFHHPAEGGRYEQNADELAEVAGRLCYKSWSRPNPATATNAGYLRNILNQSHFSVLEHASATFWISGVSRSLTHELVRHRHLSFSQVSQRYVNEDEGGFVVHPALTPFLNNHFYAADDDQAVFGYGAPNIGEVLEMVNADSRRLYTDLVQFLEDKGVDRKSARGAARSVLPNGSATELIVSGNHGAWREVLGKRLAPGADAEIRELARLILIHLNDLAPNTFQDIWEEYGSDIPKALIEVTLYPQG
jgi:thymidylate synthase (FAD)